MDYEMDFLRDLREATSSSSAVYMRDEKDGYVVSIFSLGDSRSPCAPHAPSLSELGIKIPRELESAYGFVVSGGKALMLPPDVPQERVEYLRKVFQGLNNRILAVSKNLLLNFQFQFRKFVN